MCHCTQTCSGLQEARPSGRALPRRLIGPRGSPHTHALSHRGPGSRWGFFIFESVAPARRPGSWRTVHRQNTPAGKPMVTSADNSPGFWVAPFAIDGQSEGIGRWPYSRLSNKWLEICRGFLDFHPPSFESAWPGVLSHITIKLTTIAGLSLITFQVHGRPAACMILATGGATQIESGVLHIFVESLRRVSIVQATASSTPPFDQVFAITERPVMIAVPWPDSQISEQDHSLVKELALHTAGAFFMRQQAVERS